MRPQTPTTPVLVSIVLIAAGVTTPLELFAATLSQVREITAQNHNIPTTARIIFVEQWTNNEPVAEANLGPDQFKIRQANANTLCEVNLLLDCRGRKAKWVRTDLRDINAVMAEYQIANTALNMLNLTRSETYLYQDGYQMLFQPRAPVLDFSTVRGLPGQFDSIWDLARLGVIPDALLADSAEPRLTDIIVEGRPIIRIESSTRMATGAEWSRAIDCDPALGYRFRSIRRGTGTRVRDEITADDYRDVNGIPFPFVYTERLYAADGSLRFTEKFTVEQVDFDVAVCPNDFKVDVPVGTLFTDGAISMRGSQIGLARPMGIDDALALSRSLMKKR